MYDSPEIAELKAEVAALSAVVAAVFTSNRNMNHLGNADCLAAYADIIARAGQAHPERVAAIVSRVVQQASAVTEALMGAR